METYLSKQAIAFLWAVVLGGALGAFYDLFRVGRILRGKDRPVWVFLEDLLFALGAALSTAFCFTLTNYGQVRLFLLVGEALGFTVWFHTLGAFVAKVARFAARLLAALRRLLGRIFRFFGRILRKIMNFSKKPFLFLKRWFIINVYDFKERRKLREGSKRRQSKARRKGKAGRQNEPGRSGASDRRRRLRRHHNDRAQRKEPYSLL